MPGRKFNAGSSYRYGFNGKENDNEVKGEGNQQDYGMRIYDPRLGKFLSVDPLTSTYAWYTPYSFAGNKPIWAIDLDGAEESFATSFTKFIFGSPSGYSKPKTALDYMSNEQLKAQKKFAESRAGKFTGGLVNFTAGLVGTVSSISYMVATDGFGAAVGGTIALQFSLGEMGIGTSQMMDALFSKKTNDVLQSSGSIPGLLAYGVGSKYAPFIDALGQFTPTAATSGSLFGVLKSGMGIIDAAKTLKNTPSVFNSINMLDQISDTKGFVLESFKLLNDVSGGKLSQKLSYSFTYIVQKNETLSGLASKFGTTVGELSRQNNIKNVDEILEGQEIKFNGGSMGGAGASSSY